MKIIKEKKIFTILFMVSVLILSTKTFAAFSTDEAIQKAKKYFNLTNQEVSYTKTDIEFEKINGINQECYEIEFLSQNTQYKILMSKENGTIYKIEIENKNEGLGEINIPKQEQNKSKNQKNQEIAENKTITKESKLELTLKEAKEMIKNKCPGINENNIIISKDVDDGRLQYEGKAIYNDNIYEFEIDILTKQFTKWKID